MSQTELIIDGYNFLHAADFIPRRADPEILARARQRMFRLLETRLSPAERQRTQIVFDVRRNRQLVPALEMYAGMRILNAVEHADADSLIEELLSQHPAPQQLLIVSSDRRLQQAAFLYRAQAIDSDLFFDQMQARPARYPRSETSSDPRQESPPIVPSTTAIPELSPEELDYWDEKIREQFDP